MDALDDWRRRLVLRLRDGVTWQAEPDGGGSLLALPSTRIPLGGLDPAARRALSRLAGEGATADGLASEVAEAGPLAVASTLRALGRLEAWNLLAFVIPGRGRGLAALHPTSPWFALRRPDLAEGGAWILSRFAYLHRVEASFRLESPRSHARLVLDDGRAAVLVHALSRPATLRDLREAAPEVDAEAVATFLALLAAAGLALPVDGEGETEEEKLPHLAPWAFHDLLFHARSRGGRSGEPRGKTFPFRDRFPPLPAVRPPADPGAALIPLYRPDLEALRASDTPFTAVLEGRRSRREQAPDPITVEALGELLYRAARVSAPSPWPLDATGYELTLRPSPSGGACHDLEVYLAVDRCAGLDAGLYHYAPDAHGLRRLSGRTAEVEALLAGAHASTPSPSPPQILICLASRFQRVSWAYEGIAYAVTLKNAGALLTTFYLVATAMGLSCCAVGSGDSDLFARAAGTEYAAETSVAELVVGSLGSPLGPREMPL